MFTASSHGSLRTAATHRYKASLALAYKWASRGQIGILVFNIPRIIASMCYNDFSLNFERPWFSSCTLATTASSPLRLRATESSQPLLRLDCSITGWFISWILIQKEVIIFFYHETLCFLTFLLCERAWIPMLHGSHDQLYLLCKRLLSILTCLNKVYNF